MNHRVLIRMIVTQPYLESEFGLHLAINPPTQREWILMGLIAAAGFLVGLIPGYRANRYSLVDGMSIRL